MKKNLRRQPYLKKLDAKYPLNANIQYQYAWSFDILGQEEKLSLTTMQPLITMG